MKHVMIDLETLGTSPGCSILSIGATTFGCTTQQREQFYVKVSRESCISVGLKEDSNTLNWWMKQSSRVREEAFSGAVDISMALVQFKAYIVSLDSPAGVTLWGNGADFDLPILAQAHRLLGWDLPWKFYHSRCYRTLKNLFSHIDEPIFMGDRHNALADAIHQANYADLIFHATGLEIK